MPRVLLEGAGVQEVQMEEQVNLGRSMEIMTMGGRIVSVMVSVMER